MCDVRQASVAGAAPRWSLLYAILPVAAGAFLLVDAYAPATSVRTTLSYAIAGSVWGAMAWWVRTNRTALESIEWCACASNALRIRVVRSAAEVSPLVGYVSLLAQPPGGIDPARGYGVAVTNDNGAELALVSDDRQAWGGGGTR